MHLLFRFFCSLIVGCVALDCYGQSGPYSNATDTNHPIDGAIRVGDDRFVEWANYIDPTRTQFAPRGSSSINQTGGFNSLGDLDATQILNGVSPGYLTVTFPSGIRNGAGADFAVFENGFLASPTLTSRLFAEYAYVEVSTNGQDFARFASISTNTAPAQGAGAFAYYDVTNVYNLAGKHASGYGTPFNLDDLLGDTLVLSGKVDLSNIQYVRLFDIPGNGSFTDSLGNPILDNWLTTGSGGFDFRLGDGTGGVGGIGVLNNVASVPEPGSLALIAFAGSFVAWRGRRRWAQWELI